MQDLMPRLHEFKTSCADLRPLFVEFKLFRTPWHVSTCHFNLLNNLRQHHKPQILHISNPTWLLLPSHCPSCASHSHHASPLLSVDWSTKDTAVRLVQQHTLNHWLVQASAHLRLVIAAVSVKVTLAPGIKALSTSHASPTATSGPAAYSTTSRGLIPDWPEQKHAQRQSAKSINVAQMGTRWTYDGSTND